MRGKTADHRKMMALAKEIKAKNPSWKNETCLAKAAEQLAETGPTYVNEVMVKARHQRAVMARAKEIGQQDLAKGKDDPNHKPLSGAECIELAKAELKDQEPAPKAVKTKGEDLATREKKRQAKLKKLAKEKAELETEQKVEKAARKRANQEKAEKEKAAKLAENQAKAKAKLKAEAEAAEEAAKKAAEEAAKAAEKATK